MPSAIFGVLSERPFELLIFLFLPSPSAPPFPSQRFVVTPCDITTYTQAQSSGLKTFFPLFCQCTEQGASTVWGETTGSVSTISPHWPRGTPRRFLPGNPLLPHGEPREGSGAAPGTLRLRPKLQKSITMASLGPKPRVSEQPLQGPPGPEGSHASALPREAAPARGVSRSKVISALTTAAALQRKRHRAL